VKRRSVQKPHAMIEHYYRLAVESGSPELMKELAELLESEGITIDERTLMHHLREKMLLREADRAAQKARGMREEGRVASQRVKPQPGAGDP
jgi:hypothetical protein